MGGGESGWESRGCCVKGVIRRVAIAVRSVAMIEARA